MEHIIHSITDILFPRRCPFCGSIILPKEKKICRDCEGKIHPITEPRCKKCSKPVESDQQEYCFDCLRSKHHYSRGYAVFTYEDKIKQSILDFKFKGKREYADYYIEAIMTAFAEPLKKQNIDYILPVPLHPRKLRIRGFNQAQLLAEGIGKHLKVTVIKDGLLRIKYTIPQKKLDDKERLLNLEQAFMLNPNWSTCLSGKRILIVDDIYTTGSTIEACTNLLLKAGCSAVFFVTVCIGKGF